MREPRERLERPGIDERHVVDPIGRGLAEQRAACLGDDGPRVSPAGPRRPFPGPERADDAAGPRPLPVNMRTIS